MCEPVSLFTIASAVFSGVSAVSNLMKTDKAPAIQAPTAPPQAAKTPDQGVLKRKIAAAFGAGDPTALTGPGGVSNDSLTLGKSTVLGA